MDQQKGHGQRKHATGPTLGIGVAAVVRDFASGLLAFLVGKHDEFNLLKQLLLKSWTFWNVQD